jgi:hypothetical protein
MSVDAAIGQASGRYLYAVVRCKETDSLGPIGIGGCSVRVVPYREIAAIVHDSSEKPFDSKDEKIRDYVLEHNYVIDAAGERFGTVLPFSFGVILRGDDAGIIKWLSSNFDHLHGELGRLKDMAEYSVQLFIDEAKIVDQVAKDDPQIALQMEKIREMPKGAAYLMQRSLEIKTADMASSFAKQMAIDVYRIVESLCYEVKRERKSSSVPQRFSGLAQILNLSCLLDKSKEEALGSALDEINSRPGVMIRFTGPWAPFSFVQIGVGGGKDFAHSSGIAGVHSDDGSVNGKGAGKKDTAKSKEQDGP